MKASSTVSLDVRLTDEDLRAGLAADVAAGLAGDPKTLPSKWLYDEAGCELFDRITTLPEYYPTRRERSILRDRAREIARITAAETLIEIGSGTSEKTRLLLDALAGSGTLSRIVLLDISEPTLRAAADTLADAYPGVDVHAVVGDFTRHLDAIPAGDRRLIAFLGGTIGNLTPAQRSSFFAGLSRDASDGDALLLGTDLVKDPGRLVAAYDDAAGITAAFNLNMLRMINRELGGDFDLGAFEHVAVFDEAEEWIEMRVRSLRDQTVTVTGLSERYRFAAGELMRTEISAKFRKAGVTAELAAGGWMLDRWWTDERSDFALSLSRPAR
ncbi:MAG TPA: L-histidine N(alpha)-methyltransferase [Actinomycetota bacterium]|nr:L-histidine N(alpha)-methyltransferase [Actinomycetota bacterium]